MFGFLRGSVAELLTDRLYLDVNGIGFEVFASGHTLSKLKKGAETTLFIHVNFAQDSVSVYGFATVDEREMFKHAISVSRVGPKIALAIFTALTPSEFAMCVVAEDERTLSRVPGLGKKTAQRIILELKEKIASESAILPSSEAEADVPATQGAEAEAVSALVALGYDAQTASRAVKSVASRAQGVEGILKEALKELGRRR
ncbi:MAG: Holliday junction branch migration protein RuvA [Christensenellales bacterium]|jgi:Holliday junction DNA helicase RuvA